MTCAANQRVIAGAPYEPVVAAGALETIAVVKALQERIVPPTINLDNPEPGLGIDIAANKPRPLPAGDLAAINNSFGFGGHNVSVVVSTANAS